MTLSEPKSDTDEKLARGAKMVGLAFLLPMAVVPIGIGLTVLGFLWFGRDQFGGPPLFFKIFASFIALGFVAFGAIPLLTAIYGGAAATSLKQKLQDQRATEQAGATRNLVCPHCSASVADLADVSATGDVRCRFCQSWFNTRAS